MPIETLMFAGRKYPKLQSSGFAARFAFPFAMEVCKRNGIGVDIGYGIPEWKFPLADLGIDNGKVCLVDGSEESGDVNAINFGGEFDYIFSSHCLEHLPNWVQALDYWQTKLRPGGVVCLYLPHPDQEYWLPWHNRKHIHILRPGDIYNYFFTAGGWTNVFVGERDLNHSFMAIAEKI